MKMHWVSELMLRKSETANTGWEILILVFWNIKQQQTEAHCFFNRTVQSRLPDGQQEATEEAERTASLWDPRVGRYCRSLEMARFHCRPQFYLTVSFHSVRNGSWRNQIPSVHIGIRSNEEETKVHFSVQLNQYAIGQILVRPGPEPQLSMSDLNISTILKLHQLFNLHYFDQAA